MKTIKLLLLLAISGLSYSASAQGYPVYVDVVNANCAVTVQAVWIDSLAGTTGTLNLTLNSNTASSYVGTVPALGNPAGSIYVNACATDCQGLVLCQSGYVIPGAVTTLTIDFGVNTMDNDADGFAAFLDCDDNNPSVNPGAAEVCDGIDNNCDGTIDEGCVNTGCNLDLYLFPDSLLTSPFEVIIYMPGMNGNGVSIESAIWDFGDGSTSTSIFPTYTYNEVGTYTVCTTLTYGDGCTATDCVTFTVNADGTVNPGGIQTPGFTLNIVSTMPIANGVSELATTTSAAVIYPNPVTDNAVIRFDAAALGNARIECYTTQGVLVSSSNVMVGNAAFQHTLATSELANGFYLIRVVEANGTIHTGSFVK